MINATVSTCIMKYKLKVFRGPNKERCLDLWGSGAVNRLELVWSHCICPNSFK